MRDHVDGSAGCGDLEDEERKVVTENTEQKHARYSDMRVRIF